MPAGLRAVQRRHRRGVWTPLKLPGLLAWFDAANIAGVADGGAVSTYPDAGPHGYTATQATGANQFVLKATEGPNGGPTLYSDASDNRYMNTTAFNFGPATIFVVMKITNTDDNAYASSTPSGNRLFGRTTLTTGFPTAFAGGTVSGAVDRTGAWHVFEFVLNGASSLVFVDGTQNATGNAGSNTASGGLRIGDDQTPATNTQFRGWHASLILTSDVDAENRGLARRYLGTRFAITVV